MSNRLQIDFDNAMQFPLLNAINEDLKKLIPQDLLYLESLYTTRTEKHFLSDGEKVAMFDPILNELKIRLTDTTYSVLSKVITKLKRERDTYLAVNTPTSDRSCAIENYNSIVIEKVTIFSNEVFSIIVKVFRNYVSDSNNAAALQKTDTSYCLEVWNKEFPTINDAGNNSHPGTTTENWKGLIKPELQGRLIEIESKIESKISQWKQDKMKIECAAFCRLLFEKKYFVNGSTNRATVNLYALNKYGTDISIQLISKFKAERNKHITLLKVYFK